MDVPAGVTQEEGHTGFLIHLLSALHAFIFLARRIQPFLSLVDREVEFCVRTIFLIVLHPLGILFLFFSFFSEKNPVCRDRTHVRPNVSEGYEVPLSYRSDRPKVVQNKVFMPLIIIQTCSIKTARDHFLFLDSHQTNKSLQYRCLSFFLFSVTCTNNSIQYTTTAFSTLLQHSVH